MSEVPAGWEKRTSRSTGQVYYLNQYTKQSQWDPPTSPAQPDSDPGQVRLGHKCVDKGHVTCDMCHVRRDM